jgi:hypothetical protein
MRQSRYNEIIQIDDDKFFLFNTVTCAADVVNENIIHWLKTLHLNHPNENEEIFTPEFIEKMISLGYVTLMSCVHDFYYAKNMDSFLPMIATCAAPTVLSKIFRCETSQRKHFRR